MINIQKLKNRLSFLAGKKLEDITKYQDMINGLHPHTEIIWRFINSKYYNHDVMIYYQNFFKENVKDGNPSDLFRIEREKNRQEIIEHESKLKNKGAQNLTKDDFLSYIDILMKHLAIETSGSYNGKPVMFYRHGSPIQLLDADEIIRTTEYAEKLKECNSRRDWSDISIHWRKTIVSSWKLYENGFGEYSIQIMKPIYDAFNIILDNDLYHDMRLEEDFFLWRGRESAVDFYPFYRIRNSIASILAMSYLQIGDKKRYVQVFKKLINTYPNYDYRLLTRYLEAAIRVYSEEKKLENLEKIYLIFDDAISCQPTENTESIMERCLVMYDFLYKVIGE